MERALRGLAKLRAVQPFCRIGGNSHETERWDEDEHQRPSVSCQYITGPWGDLDERGVRGEGEKDVDKLASIDVLATCNACGAGKWTIKHARFLHGRVVVILADNDKSGREHAQQVAWTLQGVAKTTVIVDLPNLPPKRRRERLDRFWWNERRTEAAY